MKIQRQIVKLKQIKILLSGTVFTLAIYLATLGHEPCLAAGGPTEGPYGPHEPVPTGFTDTYVFYLVAGILFLTGLVILIHAEYLRQKSRKQ